MENEQCKDCIHESVCAYKEHYEDAVELYKNAKNECGKYPWFTCSIHCIKYDNYPTYSIKKGVQI